MIFSWVGLKWDWGGLEISWEVWVPKGLNRPKILPEATEPTYWWGSGMKGFSHIPHYAILQVEWKTEEFTAIPHVCKTEQSLYAAYALIPLGLP